VRLALTFVLFVLAAIGLAGCQREVVPPLVEVSELAPRAIEVGDRLELRGAGFPQGRTALVTFSGVLHRAGESDTSASIDTEGVVATTERIEIPARESLEERFCGSGERATHATFVGDVEVAFASKNPGAPPLVGMLRGVTLDVRPSSVRTGVLEARAAEGVRVLAFLGMVTSAPSARGLLVDEVKRGSIAERAGIRAGDHITGVDGVHVFGLEDVLPSSSREMRLTVRRIEVEDGEGSEDTKVVPLTGYAGRRLPREVEPALVIVALALAALLLFVVPGPAALTRIEIGLVARLRGRRWSALVRSAFGDRVDAGASILGTAMLATFALGPHVLGPDLDGIALVVVATSALVAARASESHGLLATLRTSLEITISLVVMIAALIELFALGGAVHLAELVRAQGGAPWQAAAAQKPAAAVLAITYCVALVGILRSRSRDPSAKPRVRVRVLERIGLLCASAVAVAAFFGGWQLPGVDDARSASLRAAAALVFVAKTWLVAGTVSGIASLGSPCSPGASRRFAIKKLAPALVVAAILVVIERRLAPSAAVENAFGAAAVATVVLLLSRSAGRIKSALSQREPHASPFL
jgi:NADH-quinone oxidoreductase subunit H